jgi:RNase P/RNase MRP subunit p29
VGALGLHALPHGTYGASGTLTQPAEAKAATDTESAKDTKDSGASTAKWGASLGADWAGVTVAGLDARAVDKSRADRKAERAQGNETHFERKLDAHHEVTTDGKLRSNTGFGDIGSMSETKEPSSNMEWAKGGPAESKGVRAAAQTVAVLASASAPAPSSLVGSRVSVGGTPKESLNGLSGVVVAEDAEKGRVHVRTDGDGRVLAFKREHLWLEDRQQVLARATASSSPAPSTAAGSAPSSSESSSSESSSSESLSEVGSSAAKPSGGPNSWSPSPTDKKEEPAVAPTPVEASEWQELYGSDRL